MVKLVIVSGPHRGTSYLLQEGQNIIGRQAGNHIVISSSKVSKRHCSVTLTVEGRIIVEDLGSSNGTFVNGTLTKMKQVSLGERLSVGETVFEIVRPTVGPPKAALPVLGMGHRDLMKGQSGAASGGSGTTLLQAQTPTDLKGKIFWAFDQYIMPIFYGLGFKNEWRNVVIGIFSILVLGNLSLSVYPLIESNRVSIVKEVARRAQFMAKQIAERNVPYLAAQAETKTEIGSIEREDGVRLALLTDLDQRILAPPEKLNQYLASGSEAQFAVRAKDLFQKGRETGLVSEVDSSTVVAIEPLKILDPRQGKNVVVGMAVVSLDTTLSTPGIGDIGIVYSETFLITALFAAFILFILYKFTLKPLMVLNEDLDRVLKGDMAQVTHEFKWEELNPLWESIHTALQRVVRTQGSGFSSGENVGLGGSVPLQEDILPPLRMLASVGPFGLICCDLERRIVLMNAVFEEISGIRSDQAIGEEITSVARDQSLGVLANDLFDRAAVAGEDGVRDDFDFSGVSYRMVAFSFGKGYLLVTLKTNGEI